MTKRKHGLNNLVDYRAERTFNDIDFNSKNEFCVYRCFCNILKGYGFSPEFIQHDITIV